MSRPSLKYSFLFIIQKFIAGAVNEGKEGRMEGRENKPRCVLIAIMLTSPVSRLLSGTYIVHILAQPIAL
jgi:hypothetical protein